MSLIKCIGGTTTVGIDLDNDTLYKLIPGDEGKVSFTGSTGAISETQNSYALMFKNNRSFTSMNFSFGASTGNIEVFNMKDGSIDSQMIKVNNRVYNNMDISGSDFVIIVILVATGTNSFSISCS